MNQLKTFAALLAISFVALYATAKVVKNSSGNRTEVSAQTYTVVTNSAAGAKAATKVKAVNINAAKDRTLFLTSQVDRFSVDKLLGDLAEANKSKGDIYLFIDSPGGSVLDGARFIDAMEASKNPVITVCTGMCASMAAMIHAHGAKRLAHKRALLMYHPASGGVQGQVPNMLSRLKAIQAYTDKMDDVIIARSKMSKEEFKALEAYEIWIDGEDAVSKGLVDEIVYLNVELPKAVPVIFSDEKLPSVWPKVKPNTGSTKWFEVTSISGDAQVDCADLAKEVAAEIEEEVKKIKQNLHAFCNQFQTEELRNACLTKANADIALFQAALKKGAANYLKEKGC